MSQVAEPPASELRFIPASELTDVQRAYVKQQRERLQKTVPRIPDAEVMHSWVLMRGDEPIGAFTAIPYVHFGVPYAEIGLRVWSPSRGVLDAGREWLAHYLTANQYLFGRVFPDNKAVKKMVQLLGFRLTGYDHDLDGRVLERYELRRGDIVGPRPPDITDA